MQRACDHCGRRYTFESPRAKFCSDRCRRDAYKARKRAGGTPSSTVPDADGPLTRSTRAELAAVDRLESARGQAAIIAAQVIDSKQNAGSALSALLREWRVTLDAATVGARVLASPRDRAVDELEARRAQRGA